ncbi:MAG: hypothetical protein HW390_299 [Candidatus Brocadiaceae bacterium]|nr:hypothetical protein [Candidatus Brocadiaceae bacterium]
MPLPTMKIGATNAVAVGDMNSSTIGLHSTHRQMIGLVMMNPVMPTFLSFYP